jgi:hypothetical protein
VRAGVTAPDGIMVNLYGPFVGRRHDSAMLGESGLLDVLDEMMNGLDKVYSLYGDPAYPLSRLLLRPFKGRLTEEQQAFNTSMSMVREGVEWGFGKTVNLFKACDFLPIARVGTSKVALMYKVATFLTNVHTCMHQSSQIADYFALKPPTIQEYLHL